MKKIIQLLIICTFFYSCEKLSLQNIPECVQDKIEEFKSGQKDSIPSSVTEYLFEGNIVYYIVLPCCDQFNPVYNMNCEYLGAPSGGFTGGGDGRLPDFFTKATFRREVWKK